MSARRCSTWASAITCAVAALWSGPPGARAAPAFEPCIDEASAHLKEGRFTAAEATFERCDGLAGGDADRWRLLLGRALAAELAGDVPRALHAYGLFVRRLEQATEPVHDDWRARHHEVRALIAKLSDRIRDSHGSLAIVSDPPGAAVVVADASGRAEPLVAETPVELFLPARRDWNVSLRSPEHTTYETRVTLEAGQARVLEVTLALTANSEDAIIAAPPAPAPRDETARDPALRRAFVHADGGTALRTGAWASLVGGGIALALAVGFTIDTALQVDRLESMHRAGLTEAQVPRDQELRNRIHDNEDAYAVLYAVGGVAVTTAVALWLIADSHDAAPAPLRASIGPGRDGFGAGLEGSF